MSLHPHVAEPETAFSVQCTVHVRKCSLAVVAATLRLITLTLSVLLLLKCGFVSREAVSFFVTRHRSCSDAKFCCVCHVVHVMLLFMSCCCSCHVVVHVMLSFMSCYCCRRSTRMRRATASSSSASATTHKASSPSTLLLVSVCTYKSLNTSKRLPPDLFSYCSHRSHAHATTPVPGNKVN